MCEDVEFFGKAFVYLVEKTNQRLPTATHLLHEKYDHRRFYVLVTRSLTFEIDLSIDHIRLFSEIETIKIVSVSVPNRVNITSTDPVKLDCFFELNSSSENNLRDRELVVQWMFNTSILLYQWTNNGPTFLNPSFRNYIDSSYKILPNTKPTNMPLIFNARSNNMTGEYMCKVSTALNDDWKAAFLQTFSKYTIVVE